MVVIVTGASGAGKTTIVRALEARRLEGVACHYFDSIGVPQGAGASWQEAMTELWIARLHANHTARVHVLDGQVRISMARDVMRRQHVDGRIVLVDCGHETREARLRTDRGQPGLASRDMACWAAYLRGQADALGLPVIDTGTAGVDAAVDALILQLDE